MLPNICSVKKFINIDKNVKKEGIPCRILAGIASIPFLVVPFFALINLFRIFELHWGLVIILLLETIISLAFASKFLSVAIQGKTIYLFQVKKKINRILLSFFEAD